MTSPTPPKKPPKKKEATQKDKELMGLVASRSVRQATIDACNRAGLTVEKIAKTVVAALDADMVKAQLDPKGKWAVSQPFTDHVTRLNAVDKGITLLDLKPTEKHQIGVGPLDQLSDEEIDRQLAVLLKGSK